MNKVANFIYMPLDNITLKSGDVISFQAKIVNNKPWFNIIHESQFNSSSYYDGDNFDSACDLYKELLLAFKGVSRAEQFRKSRFLLDKKIDKLILDLNRINKEDLYNNLKSKPLFLGINNF